MLKRILTAIVVGVFFAVLIVLLSAFALFGYGISHAPWQTTLSLLSLPVAKVTFDKTGSFGADFYGGMMVVEAILCLIGALAYLLLTRRKEAVSTNS